MALVFLAAGTVKGISGMGLPTVSMALLGLLMAPAQAAALMVLPALGTNLAQCVGPHFRPLARRLWPLWAGLLLLTVASPLPGLGAGSGVARLALGAVLVAYGSWGLARPALPDFGRHRPWVGGVVGALTGIVTAATGVFVLPLVPYLQASGFARDELIQALGLSFAVATIALALRLGSIGAAGLSLSAPALIVAIAAAFAGLWAGTALRRRLPPAAFQRALYAVLVLLGIMMLARAF